MVGSSIMRNCARNKSGATVKSANRNIGLADDRVKVSGLSNAWAGGERGKKEGNRPVSWTDIGCRWISSCR